MSYFLTMPVASQYLEPNLRLRAGTGSETKQRCTYSKLSPSFSTFKRSRSSQRWGDLLLFFRHMNDSRTPGDVIGEHDYIISLPSERVMLVQSIPVHFTYEESGDVMAYFMEANIGMSGSNADDAKESLAYYLVDAIEMLMREEDALIPKLKQSLEILQQYIQVK